MKDDFVSEYTLFMNRYLAKHPEVVEDQKRGFNIWWDKKVDSAAIKEANEDYVPDDSYGFYPADWHIKSSPTKRPGESEGG